MKKFALCCLAATLLVLVAPSARAVYVLTVAQVGNDVVTTGQGSFNLAGLTFGQSATATTNGLNPAFAIAGVGIPAGYDEYINVHGPENFGSGNGRTASSATGDYTYLFGRAGLLFVPAGYVSGAPLFGIATYNGATFTSLGFLPGPYTFTWGTGANADSLTVIVFLRPTILTRTTRPP